MYIDGKLIGKKLKSLREEKGLSLDEVSTYLEVPSNTLTKYEEDASKMVIEIFEKILNYYEEDVVNFFVSLRDNTHE